MNSKNKILIIVFSNLRHDARVKRQIDFLRNDYSLTVLCFDSDPVPGVNVVRFKKTPLTPARKAFCGFLLVLRLYKMAHSILHDYGYLERDLEREDFQLIIANDIETLPMAFRISRNKKIFFDVHEYAPRHFEDKLWWRFFFKGLNNYLCKNYIPKVKAMTTVGVGLANEYKKHFNVRPTVITNATRYHEIQPSQLLDARIRMVYHGIANPSRKIEMMIEMVNHLDPRFTIDLILMTSNFASSKTKSYIQDLKSSVEHHSRIRILPELPSEQVVEFINQYDIGVFLIPPVNFNYANTLPNKLFEYIQARLAVAIGPTPEMAEIVKKYKIGVVSEDFNALSLASQLNAVTRESLLQFKGNSSIAAKDLCAENNQISFLKLVDEVIQKAN
ncbi:MAG TPA: hypothetical protein VFW11_08450 [Cyclobacteriaceae bacterium]|nr:hypothetical protein [Cyclobacteriaceae bacterium]